MQNKQNGEPLTTKPDIAIVGMGCMFPGAPNLPTFWQNIVSKVDAITDPPLDAWDSDVFYDTASDENDRVYCKKGGYLGPQAFFNPLEHGIMPRAIEGGEPDQWLALQVAAEALRDAGYPDGPAERLQTAVILGKGNYINRGNLTMVQHSLMVDQTLGVLKTLHPDLSDADLQLIRQDLKRQLPAFNTETASAMVPNIVAGRIANRLDLMGPSYTVDAACASSLIAVEMAVKGLRDGEFDMALAGGVQVSTPIPILTLFSQLKALSFKEQIRPFDAGADGTILSEGLGIIVLKRLADAERDHDRIYAVIKGVGTASDGRGVSVLAPRVEGEELALRRAYDGAGIPPNTVGMIEAHGTATLVGDAAEVQALTRVFGERDGTAPWCALGTVKSMIGHTMPAAGIAGMIKASLALHHKVLPPTINVDTPSPRLELDKTPFYINTETRPWIHGADEAPRRAGVNAFGFGGINAHVVLEEYPATDEATTLSHHKEWDTEVCILRASSRAELLTQGQQLRAFLQAAPEATLKDIAYSLNTGADVQDPAMTACLSIIAATPAELLQKLEGALERLADPAQRSIKARNGVYFFEEQLARTGKLAFLFPGEGAQYVNMLADLCVHFPEVRQCFDEMDRLYAGHSRGYVPSDFIFPQPTFNKEDQGETERQLFQMDAAIESLLTANHALHTLLTRLQINPDVVMGHSTGEYSAMRATGMLGDDETFGQRLLELNRLYENLPADIVIPQVTLLAVGTGRQQVEEIAAGVGGELYPAMDNCAHQVVLAGAPDVIEQARQSVQSRGLMYEALAFDRPYHTPLFTPYAEVLRDFQSSWISAAPEVPLYSCTTMTLFPGNLDEIRQIAFEHWIRTVECRQTIENMYADGVRLFVEVGPRGNLTAFVDDILRGRPYQAVSANVMRRTGITQLNHLVGLLAAHGVPMQLDHLYERRSPRRLDFAQPAELAGKRRPGRVKLATGWPPMEITATTATLLREHLYGTPMEQTPKTPTPITTASSTTTPATTQSALPPAGLTRTAAVPPVVAPNPVVIRQPEPVMLQVVNPPQSAEPATGAHRADPEFHTALVPAPTTQPLPVAADQVMSSYFQTMEHFLAVQQDIMHAFLAGGNARDAMPVQEPVQFAASPARPVEAALPIPVAQPAVVLPQPTIVVPPMAPVTTVQEPVLPAAPAVVAVAQPVVPPVAAAPASPPLSEVLVRLVSERTGYPPEMLDLTLDLEADLGVDSIKRTEIIGALQRETGLQLHDVMDKLTARKTLQGMIDFLTAHQQPTIVPVPTLAPALPPAAPTTPPAHQLVVAAAAPITPPLAATPAALDLGDVLVRLVSERTGYPPEMLDLTLDLEADLGVDSIKRTEIIGALQRETGLQLHDVMDKLTARKTLQGMIDFLTAHQQPVAAVAAAPSPAATVAPPALAHPAPQAQQPVVQLQPAAAPPAALDLGEVLVRLVSERTGYPPEMLDLTLDLEADLGVDSIKRTEIIGALQRETGLQLHDVMDKLTARKTLQGMIDFLTAGQKLAVSVPLTPAAAPAAAPTYPFIQAITTLRPGEFLEAQCAVSLEAYPFLRDHTIGRQPSMLDDERTGLPVMPLTMTMEMLAEAAALLVPGQVLVGMRDIRAYRWIPLDQEHPTLNLTLTATRIPAPTGFQARVEVREAGDQVQGAQPFAEATMVFADAYAQPPLAPALGLQSERPSHWRPERLYEDGMFHGPAFRGIVSMERWGDAGSEGTLEVLSSEGLFAPNIGRTLLTDAVLLDQPGQVLALWMAEHLERGYVIFPYRVASLDLYGPPLATHERLACRVRVTLLNDWQVRADFDVVRPDGRVYVRFTGWEDRRFDMPRDFFRFLLAPAEVVLSQPWAAPFVPGHAGTDLVAYRIAANDFSEGFFSAHGGIWLRVLAQLILSPREQEIWRGLRTPLARRLEWLLGRLTAKDAVRQSLRQHGLVLCPADIEIIPDANGRPHVEGRWLNMLNSVPAISISHTGGIAVAVVAQQPASGVGVDIEPLGRLNDDLSNLIFTPGEHALLANLPADEAWPLRFWCAKEAIGKALGYGALGGPAALEVQDLHIDHGMVWVRVTGELAQRVGAAENTVFVAVTFGEDDLVAATALYFAEDKAEDYMTAHNNQLGR